MNRITLAIVLTLFIANGSAAEKPKFLPGYIVTIEGDTLRGFIGMPTHIPNYDSCHFKTQHESHHTTYSPAKLKAYHIDGQNVMASRTIQIMEKPQEVFLEILADGKVTLFVYRRSALEYFFVEKMGSNFQRLTNETLHVVQGSADFYRKGKKFTQDLTLLLSDCNTISSQVDHVQFQEKSLTKLVEKYNQCVKSASGVQKATGSSIVTNFGILGGIKSSRYSVVETIPTGTIDNLYYATTSEVGLFLEVSSIRKGVGSSFRADLLYSNPHYVRSELAFNYYYESTIDAQQLHLPLTYKYTWGKKAVSPYVLLGVSVGYTLTVHSEVTMTSQSPWLSDWYLEDTVPMGGSVGFFGGLGAMAPLSGKLKIFLEARAEQATQTKSFSARIGIRF